MRRLSQRCRPSQVRPFRAVGKRRSKHRRRDRADSYRPLQTGSHSSFGRISRPSDSFDKRGSFWQVSKRVRPLADLSEFSTFNDHEPTFREILC
jgi:hypothetical protein